MADKQYKMLTREEALALREAGAPVEMAWVRKMYNEGPSQWHTDVTYKTMATEEEGFVDYFRVEVE